MYPYQQNMWPVGTIDAVDLPPLIYEQLKKYVALDGTVSSALPVHGSYIDFSGYKVRCKIEEMTPGTYVVRLV